MLPAPGSALPCHSGAPPHLSRPRPLLPCSRSCRRRACYLLREGNERSTACVDRARVDQEAFDRLQRLGQRLPKAQCPFPAYLSTAWAMAHGEQRPALSCACWASQFQPAYVFFVPCEFV